MTFYRRNLPHLQRDANPHFITFVTKHRWILPEWARDIVLGCCRHDDGIRYKLHVAVVMPDHVHIVLTPVVDPARQLVVSLAEIMKGIKGASAHAINRTAERSGTVWQEESFDRVLRSSESLDAKIEYVLNNPVRKGLVSDLASLSMAVAPGIPQSICSAGAHVGPDAHVWAGERSSPISKHKMTSLGRE